MMPPVLTSSTAKHLVVDNMREVAKALEVQPTWIAKVRCGLTDRLAACAELRSRTRPPARLCQYSHQYLGVECGAPCKYNAKDGTACLSVGHASNRDAANRGARAVHLVHDFIDKYVHASVATQSGAHATAWSTWLGNVGGWVGGGRGVVSTATVLVPSHS